MDKKKDNGIEGIFDLLKDMMGDKGEGMDFLGDMKDFNMNEMFDKIKEYGKNLGVDMGEYMDMDKYKKMLDGGFGKAGEGKDYLTGMLKDIFDKIGKKKDEY